MEKSFRKDLTPEQAERRWFADQLWRAFPEARSENELSEIAADVLSSSGRTVEARTVRNWLRCENTPHFRYVLRVLALSGAERLFDVFERGAA